MRNKPVPPAKWAIRDRLLTWLYAPVEALQKKELTDLIGRNAVLLQLQDMREHKQVLPGHEHLSFAYNGAFYSLDGTPGPPIRNRLHPNLNAEMAQFVDFYGRMVGEERLIIQNFLNSVMAWSQHPGDWLLVLPSSMHDELKSNVIIDNWASTKTPEEVQTFLTKYQTYFDKIRQRLVMNLIL